MSENLKKFIQNNQEKINEKIVCADCGHSYSYFNHYNHNKSKKHADGCKEKKLENFDIIANELMTALNNIELIKEENKEREKYLRDEITYLSNVIKELKGK
jgi:hypothetical protein